ncbi:hypothetical protein AX17_000597 [Amanita inopinata Kibby_2008]|nr:hypothetical protein AX17_000597 [Amanita inopinata Kibby_2008]
MSSTIPAAVLSSSMLWATPSKEWIIAPKPKPGRKPKDPLSPNNTSDTRIDDKGRRVQNRAAQRAFRERKQSQLAELQARVQSYEQGEIECNVALQNIAKRLKEENETLRRENQLLKEKIVQIEQEIGSAAKEKDKRRWRGDSAPDTPTEGLASNRKRTKVMVDASNNNEPEMLATPFIPSAPSIGSPSESSEVLDSSYAPASYGLDINHNTISLLDYTRSTKPSESETSNIVPPFDCGFCNESTLCVCREFAAQQEAERIKAGKLKAERVQQPSTSVLLQSSDIISSSSQELLPVSILDNLPAYQPAVPLRRKSAASSLIHPVFPVIASREPHSIPTCTGDPSNCMACADDAFGKAFCTAVGQCVASQSTCTNCPSEEAVSLSATSNGTNRCCGIPASCNPKQLSSPSPSDVTIETMPTNDAWRRIKAHPNVSFADLSLLAEVVARRSKCNGPTVIISPAPGEVTPERVGSPAANIDAQRFSAEESAPLTISYVERAQSVAASPSQVMSQDVILKCGRKKVCEVYADGVQDALRILDAKF